jgi:predicted metal-dependent HD superfamily phosphohydrolase
LKYLQNRGSGFLHGWLLAWPSISYTATAKVNWRMNRDAFGKDLSRQWAELAGRYSDDAVVVCKLFMEIEAAYSLPGRHYHTLSHIESLLNLSNQYKRHLHNKETVDFAIFYHDIIYDVSSSDNEERSGSVAEESLGQLKVPHGELVNIVRYIIASKTHQLNSQESETDLAWFLDFDMSILGSDWDAYHQYVQQIRQEYIAYPDMVCTRLAV